MISDNLGIRSERISKNKKKRKGTCDPIRKDCFLSARRFDLFSVCYLVKNIHLIYIKKGVAYCWLQSMSNDINVAGHQNLFLWSSLFSGSKTSSFVLQQFVKWFTKRQKLKLERSFGVHIFIIIATVSSGQKSKSASLHYFGHTAKFCCIVLQCYNHVTQQQDQKR